MNSQNFISSLDQKLPPYLQALVAEDGKVEITKRELATLVSQHTVDALVQFIRHQRKAGLQTVRVAKVPEGNISCLAGSMVDCNHILEKDAESLAKELQLFLGCDMDSSGKTSSQPL